MTNKGAVARSIEMDAQAKLRAKDQKIVELEISLGRALKRIEKLEQQLADAVLGPNDEALAAEEDSE
jgi:hypothetical protein